MAHSCVYCTRDMEPVKQVDEAIFDYWICPWDGTVEQVPKNKQFPLERLLADNADSENRRYHILRPLEIRAIALAIYDSTMEKRKNEPT